MAIRIPVKADIDTSNAFIDIEQRLSSLESKLTQGNDSSREIAELRAEIDRLKREPLIQDPKSVMVGSGPNHSIGLTPDTPSTAGTTKFLREDGTWTLIASNPSDDNVFLSGDGTFKEPFEGAIQLLPDEEQTPSGVSNIIDVNAAMHVAGPLQAGLVTAYGVYTQDLFARARGAFVYLPADQDFTTGSLQIVNWGGEKWDTDDFHSTTTNTSRITIPTGLAGKYLVTCQATWYPNSVGYRGSYFYVGGAAYYPGPYHDPAAASSTVFNATAVLDLKAGDYVEVAVLQSSGGNLKIYGGAWPTVPYAACFSCVRLGD
jgi:hypothetical protein